MKKLGLFIGLLLNLFIVHHGLAQLSIGLQGTYTKYFSIGKDSLGEYPITSASDIPSMAGGKLILDFGFRDKNAIQFGVGYHMGIESVNGKMFATGKLSGFDVSLQYKRYIMGSFNDYSGIYVMGGGSFTNNSITFSVADTAGLAKTGEARFYKDRLMQLVSVDVGLGAETLVKDKFNIFIEAHVGTHINLYKNNTTIKTDPMMQFFRMNLGFRVPLGIGGDGTGTRPRRRRF